MILLGATLVALAMFWSLGIPLKNYAPPVLLWFRSLGPWGPWFFVALYVLACLLFLPAWILTVGAGFIYGLGWGAAWVSLGATLACLAAFAVGRTWARPAVSRWVARHPSWSALDKTLGDGGFALVFLIRLSPVFPFALLNYVLGLTRVKWLTYLAASWAGMLPGIFMYVYLGTAAHSLTDLALRRPANSLGQTIFFWGGLAATALAVTLVTRLAGRRISRPAV